ncbi:MAG: geranylgeranyl reductase family protein [Bacteroidia bacterium]|jgi:geranylgeranyl reductase family protein|nr:geranylgeranyl reductase family protein [Bacteroidia bacterium]
MNKQTHYDVIIAGAGPAGSTCALALKESGLSVLMLEKETFPRDKICGDAVSAIVRKVLRELDPKLELELLQKVPGTTITEAKLYSPNFKSLEIDFALEGSCMRRVDFDNWLFTKALSNPDLTVLQQTQLKDVSYGEDCVVVKTNKGDFTADIIVGCDGAHSVVAKKLAQFTVDRKHYSGAVRQYYRNVKGLSGSALEVYFLKGYLPGYFWIFPLANNEANVGFGMLSETIATNRIDLKKCLSEIIQTIPQIAERFKDSEALEDVKGFGLPLGSKKYTLSGNRFMVCGDAAGLIDPFTGEGIETAMDSGKTAAALIIKYASTKNYRAETLRVYDNLVYDKMWPIFKDHYLLQRILGKRIWLINLLIRIGNIPYVQKNIPKWFY